MPQFIRHWTQPTSTMALLAVLLTHCATAVGQDSYTSFEGEKTQWHDGFDRYDYLLDEESMTIQPFHRDPNEQFGIKDPPPGKRRCVVVVPKTRAAGNPWSWRGCYWDHQPQTEVELLRRGFHIAYISANASLKPGKSWEAWYDYLTRQHGLSPRPAFVGMSRGGEYAYTWATSHPTQVACIYGDNPAIHPEALQKLGDLARADIPVLHVCGSLDPLLGRVTSVVEAIYHQYGGRISVMIQEGLGHHPHSLRDPTPIADFLVKHSSPSTTNPPAYATGRISRTTFYSIEDSYRYFPSEKNYITCRGPWFTDAYERYSFDVKGVEGSVNVIAPKQTADGMPWVFRADTVDRSATVDMTLLAKGFHIVTGPVPYNGDGPTLQAWNTTYSWLTEHGFSKKPVLEGIGGAAGEAYAWAIANPDKVSCLYAENPVLRCTMTKAQPLDNLAVLVKAGVPSFHVCGSLDPHLKTQTREAEKRYQELNGSITVIIQEGQGHYPTRPQAPQPIVDFILNRQRVESRPAKDSN